MIKVIARNEELANVHLEGEGVSLEMALVLLERDTKNWNKSVYEGEAIVRSIVIERAGIIAYLVCEGFSIYIEPV